MKYRKKPVVIDAIRYDGTNGHIIEQWSGGKAYEFSPWLEEGKDDVILIETLEGVMTANIGDYIICGIAGELYPCKPDIFAKTYEAV